MTPAAVELFAHYGRCSRTWAFLFPWMFMAGDAVIKDMALALAGTTLMLAALAAAGRLPVRR